MRTCARESPSVWGGPAHFNYVGAEVRTRIVAAAVRRRKLRRSNTLSPSVRTPSIEFPYDSLCALISVSNIHNVRLIASRTPPLPCNKEPNRETAPIALRLAWRLLAFCRLMVTAGAASAGLTGEKQVHLCPPAATLFGWKWTIIAVDNGQSTTMRSERRHHSRCSQ